MWKVWIIPWKGMCIYIVDIICQQAKCATEVKNFTKCFKMHFPLIISWKVYFAKYRSCACEFVEYLIYYNQMKYVYPATVGC